MPNLHPHPVFGTTYQRDTFTDQILTRREQIMPDACGSVGTLLRAFDGETDHIHLLVHH
jgi:putative transposase